jgi:cytochrome c-type biogenesis protein CcmF
MILWGESAFIASFITALAGCGIGFCGALCAREDAIFSRLLKLSSVFTALFIGIALVSLVMAFVFDDFRLVMVVENSHTQTPLAYKLVALWGNHEGSMALWLFTLSLLTAGYSLLSRSLPKGLYSYTISFQHMIFLAFMTYTLFFADPFEHTLFEYEQGLDLNPALQDPAMMFHPPGLYLGFVGASLLFSITLGGMMSNTLDSRWITHVRFVALGVWALMIFGVASGSWWAYYELGWGGWWFWDPVENVALIPLLVVSAFFHILMIYAKSGRFQAFTLFLGWGAFAFVLLGTFLVRSGLLVSVHSFAEDGSRRWVLMSCCGFFVLLGLGIQTLKRIAVFQGPLNLPLRFTVLSRAGLLTIFSVIVLLAVGIIVIGTLYPIGVRIWNGQEVSVGAAFFEVLCIPLALLTLLIGAPSLMVKWSALRLQQVAQMLQLPIIALLSSILFLGYMDSNPGILQGAIFCLALFFITATILSYARKFNDLFARDRSWDLLFWRNVCARHGKYLAHLGFGVVLLGMSVDSLWKKEALFAVREGESALIGGYRLTLVRLHETVDERVSEVIADVRLGEVETGKGLTLLRPSRRVFSPRQVMADETALYHHGLVDFHLTMGDVLPDHRHVFKLQYHPGVCLLWLGALIMILGSAIIVTKPRKPK